MLGLGVGAEPYMQHAFSKYTTVRNKGGHDLRPGRAENNGSGWITEVK